MDVVDPKELLFCLAAAGAAPSVVIEDCVTGFLAECPVTPPPSHSIWIVVGKCLLLVTPGAVSAPSFSPCILTSTSMRLFPHDALELGNWLALVTEPTHPVFRISLAGIDSTRTAGIPMTAGDHGDHRPAHIEREGELTLRDAATSITTTDFCGLFSGEDLTFSHSDEGSTPSFGVLPSSLEASPSSRKVRLRA